jgi:poly-gamma-glutamate capsule biosynthesis protein CapA/YwtB (metallophosphatase superfamily)
MQNNSRSERHKELKKRRKKTLKTLFVFFIIMIMGAVIYLIWKQAEEGLNERPLTELKKPQSADPQGQPKDDDTDENGDSSAVAREGKVTFSFVGDVMLGAKVDGLLRQYGYDYPYIFVKDHLQKADIAIANLEAPVTDRGEPQGKEYVFRIAPQALPALKASGIDVLNLANNHILDYGQVGLLDTFDYLDREGLGRVGAGRDVDEAFQPVIIEKNGLKIAILGFSRVVPNLEPSWKAAAGHPGVAPTYNHIPPVQSITKAKQESDLVVVIAHWGVERSDTPEDYQIDLAHRYIEAGADLVVASHAHVLQGFERYKGKWIAYNLGNFIFTTNNNPLTWETVILDAECTREGDCELSVAPILTKWAQPKQMSAEEGSRLFNRLTGISIHARVESDGRVNATGE